MWLDPQHKLHQEQLQESTTAMASGVTGYTGYVPDNMVVPRGWLQRQGTGYRVVISNRGLLLWLLMCNDGGGLASITADCYLRMERERRRTPLGGCASNATVEIIGRDVTHFRVDEVRTSGLFFQFPGWFWSTLPFRVSSVYLDPSDG